MVFVALNESPDNRTGSAQWYLVRNGDLLTYGSAVFPVGPAPVPGVARSDGDGAGATVGPAVLSVAGVEVEADTDPIFVGVLDGVACWAVGVTDKTELPDTAGWEPLRALGAMLPAPVWAVAGRAVHLVDWARTSRFCGRCGSPTTPAVGERAMRCGVCGLSVYPRVAPAIITLVHRDDEILLARNGHFRGRMFSVLAGFVEPGETLEDTVHREIGEEVGVRLHHPHYVASQPWPFPHSLMVGFTAEWAGGEIEVDGQEIVEAGWYGRDRLPELPGSSSIARRLIDGWLAGQ